MPASASFARMPVEQNGTKMIPILGISTQALFGQLLLGLINGAFYALLSLGLAVIFGMLNIVNFAHGALYMVGAFCAWFLLNGIDVPNIPLLLSHGTWQTVHIGIGLSYWWALLISPLVVGLFGVVIERTMLKRIRQLDPLYGLLLTLGLALIIQGLFQNSFGSSGLPYSIPPERLSVSLPGSEHPFQLTLQGGWNLGFMYLPIYRAWVVVFSVFVCLATWFMIERTRLGAYLRAATENPTLVRAFGVNVPLMITATYGFGVALAAVAGVLAAPINQVRPLMGSEIIIVVFAVVVIGGMGSILGSIITGFALGLIEGLTKVFYPEASNTVVFVIMAIVLLIKPAGLFGRTA
jgi:branched-chain amino acid transport system permease protein